MNANVNVNVNANAKYISLFLFVVVWGIFNFGKVINICEIQDIFIFLIEF